MIKYYYAGSDRVAMRTGSGNGTTALLYLFGDHLGSPTVAANPDGTLNSKQLYMPFPQRGCFATLRDGESRYTSGSLPTDYKFTGQMQEPELGPYFYGARWYDPYLGRFISPDTIVPSFSKPLSWDRFAYVSNNPLNTIDPDGHMDRDPKDDGVWWEVVTPVWIMEHIEDDNERDKLLVAFMYEHEDYDPSLDQQIIDAGYDPAATTAFLAIYRMRAEVLRLDHTQMTFSLFWDTYAAPAVAAGIALSGPSQSPIWSEFDSFRANIRTSGSGSNKRYYQWDYTHGDIEVYDSQGKHLGSMDPITGDLYKPPVPGRRIKL